MSGLLTRGCGCGQSGGGGTGCGCGRASALGTPRDGTFTRPVFFDGQLLTSDDLEALVGYAHGKNRLHNRYLVGSGVVCGLEVGCSRAHPGGVVVRPGYALDCCGNDIVVACEQPVDLNELVAELAADGCAEPCPPPTEAKPTDDNDNDKNDADDKDDNNAGGGDQQAKPQPRRYELVVEYAETPADLMAPYATDDEDGRGCEPTRYREGYRFALRCPGERCDQPQGLLGALACCAEAERHLTRLEEASSVARQLTAASGEPIGAAPSREELEEARKALSKEPELPPAVRLAAMAVRLANAGQASQASRALRDVNEAMDRVRAAATDPLSSARVDALEEQLGSFAARVREPERTVADRLLAAGVVSGKPVGDTLRSLLVEARDWALCWWEQRPTTHCRAAERLERLRLPADDQAEELAKAAPIVIAAIRQIMVDCVCAALNPPCLPCEDLAVVLAEVTIDGCEVVEVCNLVRRYALTGTALRYWLPVDWLLCHVEQFCCDEPDPRSDLLADVRRVLAALGGRGGDSAAQKLVPVAAVAAQPAEPVVPQQAPGDQLNQGQHQLLKMLNSQVQSMSAKIRKLERAAEEHAHG
jgi:hypothetical protein